MINEIKIAHLNIQSVSNKLSELIMFILSQKIDIMCLNETFLSPTSKLEIPNFNVIRLDRSLRKGGGVCIIIHHSIDFNRIILDEITEEEIIIVEFPTITFGNEKFVLASYYNAPQKLVNVSLLKKIFNLSINTLLLGDLNAHHETWNSSKQNMNGHLTTQLIDDNSLTLVNSPLQPTFLPMTRMHYASILDLGIATENIYENIISCSTTDHLRSDHVTLLLKLNHISSIKKDQRNTYKLSSLNTEMLINELIKNLPSFAHLTSSQDIVDLSKTLTESINNSVKNSTFTKYLNINSSRFLSLPAFIVNLIKTKRKIRRKFQTNRDPTLKTKFNEISLQIKQEIIQFKENKWRNFCSSLNGFSISDSKLWKKINSIDKKAQSSSNPTLIHDGIKYTDPASTASIFANELENVFKDHEDPNFDGIFEAQVNSNFSSSFTCLNSVFISFPKTNTSEIRCIINEIRGKGSPGPDQITNRVLKLLPDSYLRIIAELINASLKHSFIPTSWKAAHVTMILKPMKNPNLALSYRPISLLNTLSKLLERVVQSRLVDWCNQNNIISEYQCGFTKFRQTNDHVFRIIQDGTQAFNKNMFMGAIFIDIEKAFDRVWHKGLIFKLSELGLPDYLGAWIKNYLSERTFQVKVNGILSSQKLIRAGVPQGSILGPLLFNIYFNSIVKQVMSNKYANIALYADDLATWVFSPYVKIINKQLQLILNSIQRWMQKWRMVVSESKTIFTLFNRVYRHNSKGIKLYYNGSQLRFDSNPRFLGITLDPGLVLAKNTE